ncbi:hypothetical protein AEQU1_02959 [Aequorivita sp. CIP111184]|nr:hypothetical protein AEQU1_02959 [Aequorivita sp. CIP111184]
MMKPPTLQPIGNALGVNGMLNIYSHYFIPKNFIKVNVSLNHYFVLHSTVTNIKLLRLLSITQ